MLFERLYTNSYYIYTKRQTRSTYIHTCGAEQKFYLTIIKFFMKIQTDIYLALEKCQKKKKKKNHKK